MKKLLIMLMVVAIASFLFVGCLEDGVTPPVTPPVEPTTPTTHAPIITAVTDIDITSTATLYVNKAEAVDGITVTGTAPTYSEVKIYIDGICAGTGDAGVTGVFSVVVAKADLGTDGAKTLYATAIEAGLAESDKSNEVNFTLDTVVPSIKKSVGKSGTLGVYSFAETTDSITPLPSCWVAPFTEALVNTAVLLIDNALGDWFSIPAATAGTVAQMGEQIIAPFASVPATNPLMVGTINWKLEIINATGTIDTIRVYNLSAVPVTSIDYSYASGGTTSTSWIPGLAVTVAVLNPLTDVGGYCLITTTRTAVVAGYIDVTFDEDVTGASILAGTWTAFGATVNLAPAVTVRSSTVARLTETAAVIPNLVTGVAYSASVSGIIDLAGNPIPATAPSTSTGIVIP